MKRRYHKIDYFTYSSAEEREEYKGVWTYHEEETEAPRYDVYENLAIADLRDESKGRYYLILDRSEMFSDDLEELEKVLLDWARSEGYDVGAA